MDFSENSEHASVGRPNASRPVSRRGFREYTNSGSVLSRSGTMRPTSAYRGSTARLSTASFGPAPPTAGRQQTAMSGFSMIDRPITQQGISGLRTGTARGFRTRQLQDRRYWEELMHVKVREMKAEIAKLTEQAEAGEREKSAKKHYEKRVRELARELTDLQGRLADYNTAIRIVSGEVMKQAIEEQTKDMEKSNKTLQEEVELIFLDKQRKENQLRQLREQIDKEESTVTKILTEMTQTQKDQYSDLQATASVLRDEVEQARHQIEQLNKAKEDLYTEISSTQMKVHLLEFHKRLADAQEKRDNLKHEINNRLDPQEEREKLLLQVREDNAAISVLDSNIANLKKQIKNIQDLIEQAEQDLEEGNSERHQKYRELKKREETMDSFLSTYEDNLKREKEKIDLLERDIVFALEHSSSNIDLDLSEIDKLKQRDGYTAYDDTDKTIEMLTKDYERFQTNLKKVETTRERLGTELLTLPQKTQVMKEELTVLSDLEKLREEGEEQKKVLESELRQIKEKLIPTESAVVEALNKLKKLQESLDGNEMYLKLNSLEEQLAIFENRKTILEEDIASINLKTDYEPLKKETLGDLAVLNKRIIENLNTKPY